MRNLILFLTLIILSLASSHFACASGTELIASGNPKAPPIVWEKKGTLVGAGPELLERILKKLDVPLRYRLLDTWVAVQEKAKNGDIDLIVSAYRNNEREQYLVFSEPYLESPVVIVVPKGKKFPMRGWEDLKGKKGVAHSGESFGEKFDHYIRSQLSVEYGSYEQVFQLLDQGLADYLIIDLYPAIIYAKLLQAEEKVEFLDTPATVQHFHMAISKKSPFVKLIPAINAEIKTLKQQGICKKLVKEQYLHWRETFLRRQRFFAQQQNRAREEQQQWNAGSHDRALDTLSRFVEENRPYMFGSNTGIR